jgi:hypothetical protein
MVIDAFAPEIAGRTGDEVSVKPWQACCLAQKIPLRSNARLWPGNRPFGPEMVFSL